jgi:signal peptidase II
MSNTDPSEAAPVKARTGPHPLLRWLFGLHGGVAWLWLSVVVIVLDQYTKHYIVQHLVYAENIVVHPMLNITRLHNTGAAFSFLADASGWQHWLFIGMGVVVAIAILVWMRFLHRQPWLAAALALMLGGALGNVIDRVRFGYVIDFIHVHYEQLFWPAFNVADSALSVGAVMLVVESFLSRRREERAARGAGSAPPPSAPENEKGQ